MTTRRWILHAVTVCAVLAAVSGAAWAQAEQDGETLLAAGIKAIDAGNYKTAARDLSRAMRSDSLSTAQIAKALYLRGVAYKNAGKPAQAIADLDSALWLQGLSNKDLAQAYLTRGESYREVGMRELANADLRRAKEVDPTAKTIAAARKAPAEPEGEVGAFTTQVEKARAETASRSASRPVRTWTPEFPDTATARTPPLPQEQPEPKKQETVQKPLPGFRTEVREAKRVPAPQPKPQQKPVPGFRTSILPDEQPMRKTTSQTASVPAQWTASTLARNKKNRDTYSKPKSTVSNFFSGLWGGKEDEPEAAPAPAAQPPAADWSQSTSVASARPAPTASAPVAAPQSPAPPQDGGVYRIQLASLRTEDEAQSAWRRLASRHEALLAGQKHYIEKTTVGSLGTFYRIQIGPFNGKTEPTQLCNSLKSDGVDCFLVAR